MFKTQLSPFFDTRPLWQQRLILMALGVVLATGQAPLNWALLAMAALIGFFWLMRHFRPGFGFGWFFGVGYFGAGCHWIVEPFLVDIAATGWLAPFALFIFATGFGLFWGAAGWLTARFWPQSPVILALALAGTEWLRAHVFGGFPWNLISYIWIESGIYMLAQWIGPHGVSLATLLAAAVLARVRWWISIIIGMSIAGLGTLSLLVAVLILPFFGMPFLGDIDIRKDDPPTIRLLHPNVEQAEKWHPDTRERIFQQQRSLSAEHPPVDLIIWPETAVYFPIDLAAPELAAISNGADILTGFQRRDENGLYYNSLARITPDAEVLDIYDKTRLVPFGEFIPFGNLLARFGIHGLAAQDGAGFVAGPGPQSFDIPGIGRIQPLICYEGIFPEFAGASDRRPDLMILITNDGWFGKWAGPAQHFAQARARSIEQAIPMLRIANKGVTAHISKSGFVLDVLSDYRAGYLDIHPSFAGPATFYSRWRDLPFLLILMSCTALVLAHSRFRR